jgi:hypothetical protein
MQKNNTFLQKNLVMSKKSSTFAPAFEKEVNGDQWYKGYYVRFWF